MPADPAGFPAPADVHPDFDGHPDRPFHTWTADEKLDWIWEMMQLLADGARARGDDQVDPTR